MRNGQVVTFALLAALLGTGNGTVLAAPEQGASGKIICWKDKSGKVVGCGDKVPPEYQNSATKELDKRGVTIKQSEGPLSAEQKKAQQAELERKKLEQERKEEQRRNDKALLETFSNEKEIDLKRSRELQLIDGTIETLQTSLKNATDRYNDARGRAGKYAARKEQVPAAVQDEVDRASADKAKIEQQIVAKRKDRDATNKKYDEIKQRFIELKGGAQPTPTAADRRPR